MSRLHLEGAHETTRLIGFTDAIVGVALTMLVLPMTEFVIPAGDDLPDNPLRFVWEHEPEKLISFVASFYIVAWFWLGHHRLFALVRRADATLIQLNFLWLAGIVVLPFATAIVGQTAIVTMRFWLVAGFLIVLLYLGLILYLMGHHVGSHASTEIRRPYVSAASIRYVQIVWILFGIAIVVLGVIAAFSPQVAVVGVLFLPLTGTITFFYTRNWNSKRIDRSDEDHPFHESAPGVLNETPFLANRVKLFSDAVVAVALTLLILPLAEIEVPETVEINQLEYIWGHYSERVVAFILSFGIVAWFWLAHHRMFALMPRVDTTILRYNFFWLFGIVAFPFATDVISQVSRENATTPLVLFYLLLTGYLGVALVLIADHTRRYPDLIGPHVQRGQVNFLRRSSWVFIGYTILLIVIGFVSPSLAIFGVFGLFLVSPIASLWGRHVASNPAAGAV